MTSVEWLIKRYHDFGTLYYEDMTKAKKMNKEEISEAYRKGVEEDVYNNPLKTGEEYYNETYNK